MLLSHEVREKFLKFFEERGHKILPSSSLIPEDDPSVLLTTAGMQQFKKYFTGEKGAMSDFGTQRAASSQKCFRTTDIDEVGDERHLTFFEMLGNFSFGPVSDDDAISRGAGGYFKEAAISWAHELITKELNLPIDYVSVFAGEGEVPFDEESFRIWKEIGIAEENIRRFGREDNFWGPTGNEGPCGPTTEIYAGGIEVWNLVFNEYYQDANGKLVKVRAPGVDTGMGLERLMKVIQGTKTVFETDLFEPALRALRPMIPQTNQENARDQRIVLDHLRSLMFLIADGVAPAKTDRGYILRRILRRAVMAMNRLGVPENAWRIVIGKYGEQYGDVYPNLRSDAIAGVVEGEIARFSSAIARGKKMLEEVAEKKERTDEDLAKDLFRLFTAHGVPADVSEEYLRDKRIAVSEEARRRFGLLMEEHQNVSRSARPD